MRAIRDPQLLSWELITLAGNRRMSRKNRKLFREAAQKLREVWLLDGGSQEHPKHDINAQSGQK